MLKEATAALKNPTHRSYRLSDVATKSVAYKQKKGTFAPVVARLEILEKPKACDSPRGSDQVSSFSTQEEEAKEVDVKAIYTDVASNAWWNPFKELRDIKHL